MYFTRTVIIMLVVGFIFSILSVVHMQSWDIGLLRAINSGRIVSADGFFQVITDSAAPVSIVIPVTILLFGYFKNDKPTYRRGIYCAVIFPVTALVSATIKHLVNRPRPFVTYDFIQKLSSGGSPSFPSGHTTDAFLTAAALSLVFRKWYVIVPVYTWALLVGYSRMDLGVHYPTDVLAGICLGTVMALGGYSLWKTMANKLVEV